MKYKQRNELIKRFKVVIIFSFSFLSYSQTSCEELLIYRNQTISEKWELAKKKYMINTSMIEDIRRYRKELIDDSSPASDWRLIPITLKTLCDAINDLVGVASPSGQIINLAKEAGDVSQKSERIYNYINDGKKILDQATADNIEMIIANEAISRLGRLGAVYSFVNNLRENVNNYEQFSESKKELNRLLKMFEDSLKEYNRRLDKSYSEFEELNNYVVYIDNYLKKNCKKREEDDFWSGESSNVDKKKDKVKDDFWSGQGTIEEENQFESNTKPVESNQFIGDIESYGTKYLTVKCRDHGNIDGDRVSVKLNGVIIKSSIRLSDSYFSFDIKLTSGQNRIDFTALNEGTSSPNTAEFIIIDDKGKKISNKEWNIKTGYTATLLIITF
ncbi:hypothetical protein [Aquimarina algicola]|uniref:Uncharacterized protein n=1 Tax=Aquimarina algicola TaxID=2589995 RepID=A0A504J8D0_9FLAO|nr:hypothetical protein [Aquimarina algicola]TPN87146.1 hypothetical protein FHK87_06020 [Aquimarina algicola]